MDVLASLLVNSALREDAVQRILIRCPTYWLFTFPTIITWGMIMARFLRAKGRNSPMIAPSDVIITVEDWHRLKPAVVLGEAVVNFADLWKAAGDRGVDLPICKRQGPRLIGWTRSSFEQIHRMRMRVRRKDTRKTVLSQLSRTFSGFGGRMSSRVTTDSRRSTSSSPQGSKEFADSPKDVRSTFLMGVDDGSEDPFSSEAGFDSEGNVQTSPTEKSMLRQSTLRQSTMRSNTKGSLANRSFASEKRSYVSEASLSQSSPSLKRSATSGGFGGPKDTLFFGKEVGTLRIQDMILDRAYTFLDYVRGGLELRMMLGIDFTRSNMDKQNPDSLHSLVDMDLPTSYETAIIALGSVLRSYDTTDEYAVYGFGARIPPSHSVCSNCFALTGDFLHPQARYTFGAFRK
eukprot:s6391_g1.t2